MKIIRLAALAGVATLTLAAQENSSADQVPWGSSEAPNAKSIIVDTTLGTIQASEKFTKVSYGTGGVALRNRKTGSLSVSDAVGPVKAAFLYWALITTGPVPAAAKQMTIQREFPLPASAAINVTGTVIGTGATPCWPGDTITVLRATVPTTVATGNGLYKVQIATAAEGAIDGSDPWITTTLPLWEGASLVVVGTGTGTLAIYDVGLAGKTFNANPGLTYTLMLPSAAPGNLALFDNIGADGQHGTSRTAVLGLSDEATTINSIHVAGPNSDYVDSDWNGHIGDPLPQLWDDTSHTITSSVPAGTTLLHIGIKTGAMQFDCLTPVANVVLYQ